MRFEPGPTSYSLRTPRTIDRRLAAIGAAIAVLLVTAVAVAASLGGSPLGANAAARATTGPSPSSQPPAATPSDGRVATLASPLPPTAPPAAQLTGYRWPLAQGRITTAFAPVPGGLFIVDGGPFHDGIDIASFCGDRVMAAHDGVVIASGRHVDGQLGWVGDVAGYEARLTAKNLWGTLAVMVITDDGNGYRSVYVHLYKSLVKVGQHLKAGDLLGWEGRTGDATGCHLHYSIFSPTDTALFETDPARVRHSQLPAAEIARIDPMTVLPPLSTTAITWGWGAEPSSSAAPAP